MFYEVIPSEVYRQGGGALTYSSDQKLLPGHLVLIPVGRKTVIGIVSKPVKSVDFPTKPITRLLYPHPIPKHLLAAVTWLSEYYLSPLPACANLIVPAGIASRTVTKTITPNVTSTERDTHKDKLLSEIPLNSAQKHALKALQEAPGPTRLLRGVTGSGKTNIYLKLALDAFRRNQSTILLVPEIALTSQLIKIFEQTFGNHVILIHSKQTMSERRQIWLNILNSTYKPDNNEGRRKANHLSETIRSAADNKVQANGITEEYAKIDSEGSRVPGEEKAIRGYAELVSEGSGGSAEDERVSPATAGADDAPSETGLHTPEQPNSPRPLIIIGPRSALLTPVHNLGQIIIDEAHESAYYQENTPHYSALRLASFIASKCHIPCLLGTATPNLVDFYLAKTRNSLVELSQKAKSTAIEPKISIIDLRDRPSFSKNRYFSNLLLTEIEKNIQDKHQTLIFHNRRGSAPLTICEECGWQALCPECYLPLSLHTDTYTLRCHICGHETKVPSSCPECHHAGIIHKGFGTKLLESELAALFPEAKIARFDGDNDKSTSLANLYHSVKSGETDILIGTQTLARGLDLPHLATVGVVQADSGLALPDFAAEERTFELLTQVIGRVGRGHLDVASVIVQTYQPTHPVITTALKSDFLSFADYLLKHRRAQALPPFTYLATLSVTYKTEKTALAKIESAFTALSKIPKLSVSPPMPAFHERTTRGFTWQLVLKSPSRETLRQALLPFAGSSNFSVILDPPSLL